MFPTTKNEFDLHEDLNFTHFHTQAKDNSETEYCEWSLIYLNSLTLVVFLSPSNSVMSVLHMNFKVRVILS